MPSTISRTALESQLVARTESALRAADRDGDGAVDASERASLPSDVRPLADSTADYYLSGGPMDISQYVAAYADYARSALRSADGNGDGQLQPAEQDALPQAIYRSVVALRASAPSPTPPSAPTTPTTPSAPTSGGQGALGISGTLGPRDIGLRTVISHGLDAPTALAFDPNDGRMFVVNRGDDSSLIVNDPTSSQPTARKYVDDSDHFMNNPMAIAFSPVFREMATVQDTTNDYNRGGTGNMFMGPTLWPTDSTYDGGSASHLDMLHHSPQSMGIAAGTEYPRQREYWVFNGRDGCIDRYFFGEPHVHGGHDHSDGITLRYGSGLKRKAGVPGHVALDASTGTLFIADTGNGRIAKLDTKVSISNATQIPGDHDETPLYRVGGASIRSVTDASAGLVAPSGLVIHDGHLVVSDYGTGHIKVFTKDGSLVGDLDTGLGANAIAGLAVAPNGKLFLADVKNDRILELTVG